MSKKSLLDLIGEKIEEARGSAANGEKSKPKPATRAAINKSNAAKSTGPKSADGKAASAANSLKHGFFAHVEKLDPADAPTYQNLWADFRQGMHPDGPIEDLCCRELAMLQARLQRLESIEFALLMGNVEGPPATTNPALSPGRQSGDSPALYLRDEFNGDAPIDYSLDSRDLAQAFTAAGDALDRVHKIETHLRRAYNRTFDRLQRLQRDRLRPPTSGPRPGDGPPTVSPWRQPGDRNPTSKATERTHPEPSDSLTKLSPPPTGPVSRSSDTLAPTSVATLAPCRLAHATHPHKPAFPPR